LGVPSVKRFWYTYNMDGYRAATEVEIKVNSYGVAYKHVGGGSIRRYRMIPLNMSIRIRQGRRYVLTSIEEIECYKDGNIDCILFDLEHGGFEQYYCSKYDELVICRDKVAVAGYVAEQAAPPNYKWHEHVFDPHVDTDKTWLPTIQFRKIYWYEVDEINVNDTIGTTVAMYY